MTAPLSPLSIGDLQSSPQRARRDRAASAPVPAGGADARSRSASPSCSPWRPRPGPFLTNVELSSLTDIGWFPRRGMYDVSTLLVGTLMIAGIAMLVAAPIGLGAATYLSEYARPSVRRVLKPVLEVLASVPSVVLGLFAISFITPNLIQPMAPGANFFNVAAAGIAVGFLTIPLVASVSEDAMRVRARCLAGGVVRSRRTQDHHDVEGGAARGRVSGIVAALIVGLSRAIGETMVVAIAAGGVGRVAAQLNLSSRARP